MRIVVLLADVPREIIDNRAAHRADLGGVLPAIAPAAVAAPAPAALPRARTESATALRAVGSALEVPLTAALGVSFPSHSIVSDFRLTPWSRRAHPAQPRPDA